MKDAYDLEMSGPEEAVGGFNSYVRTLLSYGPDFVGIFDAVAAAPDDPFLNAHAAAVHMSLEAAEGLEAARPFLARMRGVPCSANSRERLFIEAVQHWAEGHPRQALEAHLALTEKFPSDLCSAKWGQIHAFNLGEAEAMLRLGIVVSDACGDLPYAKGMLAFGLEQNHRLQDAEEAARASIKICREDAWAHHALAHVFETEGRLDEGLSFMCALAPTWDTKGIFIREHNWWHIGLYMLDLDDSAGALKVYDYHLWGEWPEFGQEQIGAISMLWRMELRGVDVGDRWAPVINKVAERGFEHIQPFHDLHYAFALAKGGDEKIGDFLRSLENHSACVSPDMREVWLDVCLPAAQGIAAYALDDFARACEKFGSVLDRLASIGGSHAQRDLFHQTFIEAALRCGERETAKDMLHKRIQFRPHDLFALARV